MTGENIVKEKQSAGKAGNAGNHLKIRYFMRHILIFIPKLIELYRIHMGLLLPLD